MRFSLENDAFRRALVDNPHYASFENLLRAWAAQQHWDPVWNWATRPIYQIRANESLKAFDDFVRVVAATGFYFVLEGLMLLVRTLPANQALLDWLMVSVVARYSDWRVERATDFPTDPKAWDYRSLTIDMKLAIYRRIALGDVKDVDLYPKMLKILGSFYTST